MYNRERCFLWWSPLVWTCLTGNQVQCRTREVGISHWVKWLYSKPGIYSFWSLQAFFLKSPGRIKPIAKQSASPCAEAMPLVNPKLPCRTVLSQERRAVRTASWVSAGYSIERLGLVFYLGNHCFLGLDTHHWLNPSVFVFVAFAAVLSKCSSTSRFACSQTDAARIPPA